MTKAEYMEILQEKLEKFSQELQEEILEDYRQHFIEGEQLGKTDEEIIEELGNIEDMIRELPEEECVEASRKCVANVAEGGIPQDCDGRSIAEIVEAESEKSSIYNGVYREIVLDGLVADVTVEESTDGRIYVDYQNNSDINGKLRYEFYQYERDGVFYAGVKRREGVEGGSKKKQFSFLGHTISFENAFGRDDDADIQLRAKVPGGIGKVTVKTSSGEIKIWGVYVTEMAANSASGDVNMRDLRADSFKFSTASGDVELVGSEFKSIMLNTASGDVNVRNVNTESMQINTASGDLSLQAVKADSLKMNAASGDMDLLNVEAKTIQYNSASGDISGRQITVMDHLQCSTASGDIELCATARSFKLSTASGDAGLQCNGTAESINIGTGSGDVDLKMNDVTGMEITSKTHGGDVDIYWSGQSCCVKNATSTFGDGSCKVNIKTGSGDIKVHCR